MCAEDGCGVCVGRLFLDHVDGDDRALHGHIPGGAGPPPSVGGEAAQAGDVAGGDGAAHGQSPRHGRHRRDAHRQDGRSSHSPAAAAAAATAADSDATTTGDQPAGFCLLSATPAYVKIPYKAVCARLRYVDVGNTVQNI